MKSAVSIRSAEPRDAARWHSLWAGYVAFYESVVPDDVTAHTWARILDPVGDLHCLVAELDAEVIGICVYLFHAATWSLHPACYLEDLFVDPKARRKGAGRALIEGCAAAARSAGASSLYWQTESDNRDARALYDTLVPRSPFIVYRKAL